MKPQSCLLQGGKVVLKRLAYINRCTLPFTTTSDMDGQAHYLPHNRNVTEDVPVEPMIVLSAGRVSREGQ